MALLQAVNAATAELGLQTFTSIVGSSDRTAAQLLALANAEVLEQRGEAYWEQANKLATITLVAGQEAYALPADMYRAIPQTHWDGGVLWPMKGPFAPQDWQYLKNRSVSSSFSKRFRVKGAGDDTFYVDPAPSAADAGQVLTFEYQSTNMILPKRWTTSTSFAAGSYCSYNGLIFYTSAGGTTGATPPTGTGSDGGVSWDLFTGAYEAFLADTDRPLLGDRLLTLGLKWRFRAAKRLDYAEEAIAWRNELTRLTTALNGAPVLSISPRRGQIKYIDHMNLPDTGYQGDL